MDENDNANFISESEESVIELSNASDENTVESIISPSEITVATSAVTPIKTEQIDLSAPAFIGFGLAVAVVFASLGVAVFLRIFKKA